MAENSNADKAISKERIKSKKSREDILEIIVAIFLGVTALATAWASWIGSLHGGNQATNYTQSNNMAADGNSRWNEASQNLMQDMMTWNEINQANLNYVYAEQKNDKDEMEKYQYQLEQLMNDNCSDEFLDAINWALDQKENVSPFTKDGYVDSYFADANSVLEESNTLLEQGKKDNANGDAYGLVTVIYSVVLFMLGIVGTFKRLPNRTIVLCVAIAGFLFATIYMITIPLPTGFNLLSYFGMA